jgi:hypothetical protein
MALAAVATLVGAAMQSATGFGFALILSPALFAVLDRYEAVTALLALGVVLSLLVLFEGGRPGPVRWRQLVPVRVVVVAIAAWQLRSRLAGSAPAAAAGHSSAAAAGLASGILTTSINVSGPPLVLWLESRGPSPAELRATLAALFLVLNLAGGAVLLVAAGPDRAVSPGVLLPLLGLVVVGYLAGAPAFKRLDQRRFSLALLALVAITGVASVVAGALSLAG